MSGGGPEDDPFPAWLSNTIVVITIALVFVCGAMEMLGLGGHH